MLFSMSLEYPSVLEFGLTPAADVFTRGFADYLVKITASPAMLLGMARADSVDFEASRVALRDGEPVAAALIARRGWTCRLAGMCVTPAARRHGVGRALLQRLLDDAAGRSERAMVLEVIAQNAPAVRLYEAAGFTKVRRLVGFTGAPAASAPDGPPTPEAIDIRELAAAVGRYGLPDLPWQISAETLAQQGPPARAFRCGASLALISDPDAAVITIRALLTEPTARGRNSAAGALRALMARWPDKTWRVSAVMPEEMAPAFAAAGLAQIELSQWQMARPLA